MSGRRFWLFTVLVLLLTVMGAGTALAADVDLNLSTPGSNLGVCVVIDGTLTCTPRIDSVSIDLGAHIADDAGFTETAGAPTSQAAGNSCNVLARTYHIKVDVGGTVSVAVHNGDTTVIDETSPAAVVDEVKSIEVCVSGL